MAGCALLPAAEPMVFLMRNRSLCSNAVGGARGFGGARAVLAGARRVASSSPPAGAAAATGAAATGAAPTAAAGATTTAAGAGAAAAAATADAAGMTADAAREADATTYLILDTYELSLAAQVWAACTSATACHSLMH